MYKIEGKVFTFVAIAAVLEAVLVKLWAAEGTVEAATGATQEVVGVVTKESAAWQSVPVQNDGIARVRIAGTVAVGAKLTATTWGAAIATTTAGNVSFWQALQAGAAGDIIPVLLQRSVIAA